MAALTDWRDTSQLLNRGTYLSLPVKSNTTIYQGSIVALDGSGFAVPGKKAAGLTAAGRAEATVTNAGADGAATIEVQRGVFLWENTGTAANKLGAAHILGPCYMEDDQTVTALATGASLAGRVIHVYENSVAVEIGSGPLPAPTI